MTIAQPSTASSGFCALVPPGETCLSNMELGKLYLGASIAGEKRAFGSRFSLSCSRRLTAHGSLAERFITLMAVSFVLINTLLGQRQPPQTQKHWATAREDLVPRFTSAVKTTVDRSPS